LKGRIIWERILILYFFDCINIFVEVAAAKFFVSRSAGGSWTPNKHGAANAWFLREENKKISGCASAPYFFFPHKRLMLYPVA
jgi:hypothetical protein